MILLNSALSSLTHWQASPLNLSLKTSLTFSFNTPCSSNHCPFSLIPLKLFLTFLHLITEWKYFVLKSPYFNHLRRAFWCNRASWLGLFLLCYVNNHFLSSLPNSSNSLLSSFVSSYCNLLWISSLYWKTLSKTSLFQTFKSDFNIFNFFLKINIPLPLTS